MTAEALLAGRQGHHPKVASAGEGALFSSSGYGQVALQAQGCGRRVTDRSGGETPDQMHDTATNRPISSGRFQNPNGTRRAAETRPRGHERSDPDERAARPCRGQGATTDFSRQARRRRARV
jgi:hypothetical protein